MPTIADYLKYANLQMAAEAFIRDPNTGVLRASGQQLIDVLVAGNGHASRFTQTQAEAFADANTGWTVLDQRANTSTGFSGTLFKNNQTGELVISFRSTEFIDDAARDNLATNTDEIKNSGWGQISDMEAWYASLHLAAGSFSVTGYSLGGHLATAFNLLHPGAAQQVITFNGAGVGKLKYSTDTLSGLLQQFNALRSHPDQIEASFTDAGLRTLYHSLRTPLTSASWQAANTAGRSP